MQTRTVIESQKDEVLTEELPEPFLGRMIVEITTGDAEKYIRQQAGLQGRGLIDLSAATKDKRPPTTKGIIIKMAPDAFGEAFHSRYGNDCTNVPVLGDEVAFVNNDSYPVNLKGTHHLVADQDIVGIYRKSKTKGE